MQKLKPGTLKNIALVLFLGIAIFSAYKYIITLKEKYALLSELAEKKIELEDLQKQKQNLLVCLEKEQAQVEKLSQEKEDLKDYPKAGRKRLSKLFAQVAQNDKATEAVNTQVELLKKENKELLAERDKLAGDNEALNIKLNSIIELKKAISELKRQARRVGKEMIHQAQADSEGNRGYILKEGKPTLTKKVKIEVTPALQAK